MSARMNWKLAWVAALWAFWAMLSQAAPAPRAMAHVRWDRLSLENIQPDELVVGYKPGHTPDGADRPQAYREVDAHVTHRYRKLSAERLALPAGRSLDQLRHAAERIAQAPGVAFVEPNFRVKIDAVPNDPAYPGQLWGLAAHAIGAEEAWDITTGSEEIVVAVVDTGINREHEDLAANMWINPGEVPDGTDTDGNGFIDDLYGWDFVNNDNDPSDGHGHGTHCAGTIGAVGNNGLGIVGVNWNVRLVALKGLADDGYGDTAGLAAAVEYIAWFDGRDGRPRIHLSNNSWGGGGESVLMRNALEMARESDQLFVAAAGNDSLDNDLYPHYPSSYSNDNIVAVASLTDGDPLIRSSFSCYGAESVDLGAPGQDIYSCRHNDNSGYVSMSGTSMATPHVSGAAALLWSLNPNQSYTVIRDALLDAAREPENQIPDLQGITVTGGKLHLPSAIQKLRALLVTPNAPVKMVGAPGGPFSPESIAYTVRNATTNDLDWDVTVESDGDIWLDLSSSGGTLAAAASDPLTATVNSVADGLPRGTYTNELVFSNLTDPDEPPLRCQVLLRVSYNYEFQSKPYEWTEVGVNAVEWSFSDLGTLPVTVPFDFRFYNETYSQVFISEHGALSPVAGQPATRNNDALPMPDGDAPLILPYWDHLQYVPGTSGVFVEHLTNGVERLVVTFERMALGESLATPKPRIDFQVVLYANQDENSDIAFHYRTVAQDDAFGAGRAATVGLQDHGAFLDRTYAFNGTNNLHGTMELADRQGLLFTWRERLPDSLPPSVGFKLLSIVPGSETLDLEGYALCELRFDEIAVGLDPGDIDFTGTTVAGAQVTRVSGGGERFLVAIEGFRDYGRIVLRLKDAAVNDLMGNPNAVSEPFLFTVPFVITQVLDDFEQGIGSWTFSTNVYQEITTRGWELGAPPNTPDMNGFLYWPTNAFSGQNCWGTVLSNQYPAMMDAWLQSPEVHLADSPVLDFRLAYDIGYGDWAVVEGNIGSGWVNLLPGLYLTGSSGGAWERFVLDLPPAFANQRATFRIRMVSDRYEGDHPIFGPMHGAGVYVDDFRLISLETPGIWLLRATPNPLQPDSETLLDTFVYNSSTQTIYEAAGMYGSPDSAMAVSSTGTVYYGHVGPGDILSNRVVMAQTAPAQDFVQSPVYLTHRAFVGTVQVGANAIPLEVDGLPPDPRDRIFTAAALVGVVDWLQRPLAGNGDRFSTLYQIIHAGADGQIDPPKPDGSPGGDDSVLYSRYNGLPYARFGAEDVAADLGRFRGAFRHNLPSGAVVYARAWDASNFDAAVAYGDSHPYVLTDAAMQSHDFQSWVVDRPTQYRRDSNGDTIPDGWAIENGLDPRATADGRLPSFETMALITGNNLDAAPENDLHRPRRAGLYGASILATSERQEFPSREGAVMVFDAESGAPTFSLDRAIGETGLYRFDPSTLCVDAPRSRLIVGGATERLDGQDAAERVLVFDLLTDANARVTNAALAHAVPPFGTSGYPNEDGRFKTITDVVADANGFLYVVDSQLIQPTPTARYYRLQRLDPDGANPVVLAPLFFRSPPSALAIDDENGWIYVADVEDDVIQKRAVGTGALQTTFGGNGTALGQFDAPQGMSVGESGRLYVMEEINQRLQILDSSGNGLGVYPYEALNQRLDGSDASGWFNLPQGVWVMPGAGHRALAADTGNDRVYWMELMLDVDGDGMDDVWEDVMGLDSSINDAADDPDGDGLSNLGEYRAGTDPLDPDSNDNGAGDLWDMNQGDDPLNPLAPSVSPPGVISLAALPDGLVAPETLVTISAVFDEDIAPDSVVTLTLSGGAVTPPLPMTRQSPTLYTIEYVVQGDDTGDVYGTLSGAFNLSGFEQDPVAYPSGVLFTTQSPAPYVMSLTADDPGPLQAGETVLLTAVFSEDISSLCNVTIELFGGAVTLEHLMTRLSPTTYTYAYEVQPGDLGDVYARIRGAVDMQDLPQSPDPFVSGALFNVEAPAGPFAITTIRWNPLIVEWEVVSGGEYVLRSAPTPTGVWIDVTGTLTAPADGVLGYTNPAPADAERFFRAIRLTP